MSPLPSPDGPFDETQLRIVMEMSYGQGRALAAAPRCGCYHCGAIFAGSAIRHWVDVPDPVPGDASADAFLPHTAVCPYCHVDAVIGDSQWTPVTPALLAAAHARWFGSGQGSAIRLLPGVPVPPRAERVPRAPGVIIPADQRALLDGVRRLGTWLCTLPETSEDDRAAIRRILGEWDRLPALTPGFRGEFQCSVDDRGLERPLWRVWCVEIDEPDDAVCVYGFAYDQVGHDVVYAMTFESYHSWHRGVAELGHDAAPARWLADVDALPTIRARGTGFEVRACVSSTTAPPPA